MRLGIMKLTILLSLVTVPAMASVLLTFEGIPDVTPPGNFYNGGAGGNFGITFSSNVLALIDSDAGGSGSFANEPSPSTVLTWFSSNVVTVNVAGGFTSFFDVFVNAAGPYSISVFAGSGGTGLLLGSFNGATGTGPSGNGTGCPGDPTGALSCWGESSVTFSGTASSVVLSGTNLYDNMSFGVPEPATFGLAAFAIAVVVCRNRRSRRGV